MTFDFKAGIPIYAQIIDELKLQIASGKFKPGDKFPSVRELALEAQVNPNTMQKALAELERDGYIYTVRTTGRFVTDEQENIDHLKRTLAETHIQELFDALEALGLTDEQIINLIIEWKNGR